VRNPILDERARRVEGTFPPLTADQYDRLSVLASEVGPITRKQASTPDLETIDLFGKLIEACERLASAAADPARTPEAVAALAQELQAAQEDPR
jgi:hypothetical protein